MGVGVRFGPVSEFVTCLLGWIYLFLSVVSSFFCNYSVVPDLPSNIIRNIKFVIIFQSPQQRNSWDNFFWNCNVPTWRAVLISWSLALFWWIVYPPRLLNWILSSEKLPILTRQWRYFSLHIFVWALEYKKLSLPFPSKGWASAAWTDCAVL